MSNHAIRPVSLIELEASEVQVNNLMVNKLQDAAHFITYLRFN